MGFLDFIKSFLGKILKKSEIKNKNEAEIPVASDNSLKKAISPPLPIKSEQELASKLGKILKKSEIKNKNEVEIPVAFDNSLKKAISPPLPIKSEQELASKLGITQKQLELYVNFQRKNYYTFYIPKKNGDKRRIDAPKKRLKQIQRWILENILSNVEFLPCVNGFVKKRSIKTNADQHVNKEIVLKLDLYNFFPSIGIDRVIKVFRDMGYSKRVSKYLAKLVTYKNKLPQGAPTSPALSNIVCKKLDTRLFTLVKKLNELHNFECSYTRYADDITFSGNLKFRKSLYCFIPLVKKIINDEGFKINKRKITFMRKGSKQTVTGLVVNKKVNIPREKYRIMRSIIHNLSKISDPTKKKELQKYIEGYLAFTKSINLQKYQKLKDLYNSKTKYGY